MNFAKLQIRDGGIFTNHSVPAAELRARAFLAHADELGKTFLKRLHDTHSNRTFVFLSLEKEPTQSNLVAKFPKLDVNEGFIVTADTGAWSSQTGFLVLCLPYGTDRKATHELLERYFKASHRWLADNEKDRQEIERVLSSEVKA